MSITYIKICTIDIKVRDSIPILYCERKKNVLVESISSLFNVYTFQKFAKLLSNF